MFIRFIIFSISKKTTKQRELRSHQMKHNTIQNKWINECIDTQVDTCKTFIYNISETHEYSVVMNLSNSFIVL